MRLGKLLRGYRTVHPRSIQEDPLALAELHRGNGRKCTGPIVLESLDGVAQMTPEFTVSGRQLWKSTKLLRENRQLRRSLQACVVGGADAIRRVWRDYKIQPHVVYVPNTEPAVPAWCLQEELPSCVVCCSPVDVNKSLLSAERGDGYAAEFPIPTSFSLEAFLGYQKPTRLASVLVLVGLRIPSNVGVLIRAAVDMGFESVILDDCVDLFHEKVLRASGGAVFAPTVKVFEAQAASTALLNRVALEHQLLPLLAVPSQAAEPAFKVAHRLHKSNALRRHNCGSGAGSNDDSLGPMLILGSESKGLASLAGKWTVPHCMVSLQLPNSSITSINVGVAGSVLLHAFRPAAEKHYAMLSEIAPKEPATATAGQFLLTEVEAGTQK
ncbi:putative RNA methyltransferase [Trypanosoma rangeli]|uniref:Putative RNA methyltransferase n=1 Tax=Trypanosoma rangeli TaxID=5698 RepID=A0A3R7R8W6_TRYRA|nr:putative RNA methyltransferase [Trypanosoma rangeli]RNE98001.1 putative RNA methyltransferase [Trypanosoma rangeli]|eukprot:RNE98001.1 putative RNA methyltransferase [Trypanosoma rangeli]